ncbi:MAG: hypothetical protein J3R72DRAFT_420329 [Linnemannia gamsii]|nr:MAG: hypothetical protein J3R72DRAFT_420329 [Linnemannia gamsii]
MAPTMFKYILLVGLALAATFVVEAKLDIVFATEKSMKGDRYPVCYTSECDSFPKNVQSLRFANYDFPDHKDFSIPSAMRLLQLLPCEIPLKSVAHVSVGVIPRQGDS